MMHPHDPVARRLRRPALLAGLCLSLGAVACAEHDPSAPNSPEEADRPAISVTRPEPAANVRAGASEDGGVLVAWTDASSNEDGFRILRSVNGGAFEAVGIGDADTETYGDYTVVRGQTYRYAIAPFNSAGDASLAATPDIHVD